MFFSLTGIAYLTLSIAVGFLAFRFFQYWQQKKDTTSRLFFYFIFSLFLFAFYKAIVTLFFINSTKALVSSIVFATFIEGVAAAVIAYLVFYLLKFSKNFSWLAFFTVFIYDLAITWFTANMSQKPIIEASGSINWWFDQQIPLSYLILRFILFSMALVPLAIILIKQYMKTKDRIIKSRAFGLGMAVVIGILIGFMDFLMVKTFNFSVANRDIAISILGIFLFLVIYLTQKPPTSEKI